VIKKTVNIAGLNVEIYSINTIGDLTVKALGARENE